MTKIIKFIAGDWGTSNLRLYLCEYKCGDVSMADTELSSESSKILESRFGPGISQINGDFEDKFFSLAQDWLDEHGKLPVLLSGMIGSTIGWKEAPYLTCPVNAEQIASGRLQFESRGIEFSILAGLRTQNPLGTGDVMRGEELQLLGWLGLQESQPKQKLFALPGTHNKWTLVENGVITNFLTAFTGELFALLRNHSILITEQNTFSFNKGVFIDAVNNIEKLGNAQLVHALFSTRSKQVLGEMAGSDALSYLSGLVIGADVIGAKELFSANDGVTIIGDTALAEHYALALNHFGIPNDSCNPADIAIAGYGAIFKHLIENTES